MRKLVLLASLVSVPASAADTSISVGANAGVFAFDSLDQAKTSWLVVPRVGFWFTPTVALELESGISTGNAVTEGHHFLAVTPQIGFTFDPLPVAQRESDSPPPVRPLLSIGGGLYYKDVDDAGEGGADFAHTRYEGFGSFGGGLFVPFGKLPLGFRTDARVLVSGGERTDLYQAGALVHFAWTAGLEVRVPLARDKDKDKVPDRIDRCPEEPEDRDGWQDDDGCPDPDNDGDGILDAVDQCPDQAEDRDGWQDGDGCPDPDNDGDGLLDEADRCPVDAGTPETAGCPDTDGDMIADLDDACPTTAGLPEFRGCPDTDGDGLPDPDDECPTEAAPTGSFGCPDRDGDLVPDYRDACPDKRGPAEADPKRSNGCPTRVFVASEAIRITEQVQFDTGTARIRPQSYGLLNDVAAVLKQYPDVRKVRVEGHTDDVGDDASNLALSQRRAEAVVRYLVEETGIEPERLEAAGYGESRPIADNRTAAGRQQNRRVAFTILEQGPAAEEQAEQAE